MPNDNNLSFHDRLAAAKREARQLEKSGFSIELTKNATPPDQRAHWAEMRRRRQQEHFQSIRTTKNY